MQHLREQLGKAMKAKEVAEYLNIDIKIVRKYYLLLGGVRYGKSYRFFERRIINAIQAQWEMVGTDQIKQPDPTKDFSDKRTSKRMGGKSKEEIKEATRIRDPFNLLT